MPRRHRQEDIYWNAIESDSDESLKDYHRLPTPSKDPYIDPWDLENYAYIREHLESTELSSNPSLPFSGSSGSGGDFAEANSFCYVAGSKRLTDGHNDVSGDYADIDEVKYVSRREIDNRRRSHYDFEEEENPYEIGLKDSSVFGIYDQRGQVRRVAVPVDTRYKTQLDRSLSSSYGEYTDYDPYSTRQEIYSKLDDMPRYSDTTMPIYDDVRRLRRKPQNFGLTNYGHLKIDYSISWNDLNKYIKYNN